MSSLLCCPSGTVPRPMTDCQHCRGAVTRGPALFCSAFGDRGIACRCCLTRLVKRRQDSKQCEMQAIVTRLVLRPLKPRCPPKDLDVAASLTISLPCIARMYHRGPSDPSHRTLFQCPASKRHSVSHRHQAVRQSDTNSATDGLPKDASHTQQREGSIQLGLF